MDNGGGSSCMERVQNMKLAETIDMVLFDLMTLTKTSLSAGHACVYICRLPSPAACDQKSAQWNCSCCSRVMAYESCQCLRILLTFDLVPRPNTTLIGLGTTLRVQAAGTVSSRSSGQGL